MPITPGGISRLYSAREQPAQRYICHRPSYPYLWHCELHLSSRGQLPAYASAVIPSGTRAVQYGTHEGLTSAFGLPSFYRPPDKPTSSQHATALHPSGTPTLHWKARYQRRAARSRHREKIVLLSVVGQLMLPTRNNKKKRRVIPNSMTQWGARPLRAILNHAMTTKKRPLRTCAGAASRKTYSRSSWTTGATS